MEDSVVLGTMQSNMPELPEVETVKNTLSHLVEGKTITDVKVLRAKNIESDVNQFVDVLKGSTIVSFSRVGKFIIFHLDKPYVMISHLRMEGKYFLRNRSEEINKHDIVLFYFSDDTYLAYNDTRKFGILKLCDNKTYLKDEPLVRVGPDPFMMKDESVLVEGFKNKNIAIKTALLDQSIMSGLGNIYVDEVLFECKVHPETPAKLVDKEKLHEIYLASRKILKKAIEEGGSTIKSYHPQEGVSGNFQVSLKVYGKKDGTCTRCHHHLRKIFVNGRGTTFCPNCQKNPIRSHVIGITGPIGSGKSTVSKFFEDKGYKYYSADKIVHELYKEKTVIDNINKMFPNVVIDGAIDFNSLREDILSDKAKKIRLEKYIHALVEERIDTYIRRGSPKDNIVLEVPLLFESHLDDYCDETILVNVDYKTQRNRLIDRGVDPDKYLTLNSNFELKKNKEKATFIVDNILSKEELFKKLEEINDKVMRH